jgi:rfaE bifunctional protein kinase chain/domain/rfaE bifunctional protein nucleotidyltransferase chain/domain
MAGRKNKKNFQDKIVTVEALKTIIGSRPRKKSVIMCHGTFDVVHPGHIRHLIYAKQHGDILIASLTADAHVIKADKRPYVPESLRAVNLAALEMVDYVIIDADETPLRNITYLQPDFFAKGYEYSSSGVNPKTKVEIEALRAYGGDIIFTPGDIIYSSSNIIENSPPDIGVEKLLLLMDNEGLTFKDVYGALDGFERLKVHVVGDTIVDSLTNCSVIGGSTKTPTLSVRFEDKQNYVGGAGIVAKHLKAAGADVTFSTILGEDEYKDFVLKDLQDYGVTVRAIIDRGRPTTNKNAIVASGYRLLKVDTLDNRSISPGTLESLISHFTAQQDDVLIFSDFRHGIFNRDTIPAFLNAIRPGVLKVADSQVASRWGNILEFQGVDLITPNEREARFALSDQDTVVRPMITKLHERAQCKVVIMKMGKRGILLSRQMPGGPYPLPGDVTAIDSFAGHVVDAVGAGDALLAYSSLVYRVTQNALLAAIIGDLAAGIECERDGNIPVKPDDVRQKIAEIEKIARFKD